MRRGGARRAFAWQVWGKTQPQGSWAFVLLNSDPTHSMSATIDLGALTFAAGKLSGAVAVRDIWARATMARHPQPVVDEVFRPPAVPPRDSAFYLVSPV
jgi:hypothetical protein